MAISVYYIETKSPVRPSPLCTICCMWETESPDYNMSLGFVRIVVLFHSELTVINSSDRQGHDI